MPTSDQNPTKAAYLDPQIVAGYIEKHAKNPKMLLQIESFAKTLTGTKVLDLGCGPGQDSYHFSKLGFEVTGVDYSSEMIQAAKGLQVTPNPPKFMIADMREIGKLFDEDSYDAVWASASLLHIPQNEISDVLDGIKKVVKNNGKVYIGLKKGEQGEKIVTESKYGKRMEREFTFWEKDILEKLLKEKGFKVEHYNEQIQEGDYPTTWLNFFLRVEK